MYYMHLNQYLHIKPETMISQEIPDLWNLTTPEVNNIIAAVLIG